MALLPGRPAAWAGKRGQRQRAVRCACPPCPPPHQLRSPTHGSTHLIAPPWQGYDRATGRNASKEETGINSAGVAISDTETIFNSEAALAADPYVNDTGLVEDGLTSVLLPQARSAVQGVRLLGQLIAAKGAGEGGRAPAGQAGGG